MKATSPTTSGCAGSVDQNADDNDHAREFVRFIFVGGAGFCVDAGVLTLMTFRGWDVVPARGLSFALAVSVTWLLNRIWTFRRTAGRSKGREYALYVLTQTAGALINLGIFFLLVALSPSLSEWPFIPLAIGAVAALGFNFVVSKRWIFVGT